MSGKKSWINREDAIGKLFASYSQMLDAGEHEKAKGVYRAIKLLRRLPSYYSNGERCDNDERK